MARKPNYAFERRERDRAKVIKLAERAEAKRQLRERKRAPAEDAAPAAAIEGAPRATAPDET